MSNVKSIIRAPDPTTKIITLDMQGDDLVDSNGKAYNVELTVDGSELRGLRFTVNNGAEDLVYGSNDQSIILALRTANEASTCVVYSLDAGVADTSKIYVTGSVFGDGVLTRAIHIGLWGYKADVGSGHYCSDLNLWTPAP